MGYISLLALYQVLKGLPDVLILFNKTLEYLFNGIQYSIIGRDYCLGGSVKVKNTPLLDSNVSDIYKEMTRRKRIISRLKKTKNYYYLPKVMLCIRQSCVAYTHSSLVDSKNISVFYKYNNLLILLWFSNLRVNQRRESCIRVNTRELNRELSTGLSTLYTSDYWSEPTLSDYMYMSTLRPLCI